MSVDVGVVSSLSLPFSLSFSFPLSSLPPSLPLSLPPSSLSSQTYLPHSVKKIYFTQELYILVWKLFELNKKFLVHVLRSPHLFDLLVPLLHQVLETRTNPGE